MDQIRRSVTDPAAESSSDEGVHVPKKLRGKGSPQSLNSEGEMHWQKVMAWGHHACIPALNHMAWGHHACIPALNHAHMKVGAPVAPRTRQPS